MSTEKAINKSLRGASPAARPVRRRSRVRRQARVVITALSALLAVTASGSERLYVITAPVDFARPATIVAFEVDSQGLPIQRESYPTGGAGSGGDSGEGLVVHPS